MPKKRSSEGKCASFKNIKFQTDNYQTIAQRHKHSSLYCSPQWQIQTLNMSKEDQPALPVVLPLDMFSFFTQNSGEGPPLDLPLLYIICPKYRTHKVAFAVQLHKTKLYNGQLQAWCVQYPAGNKIVPADSQSDIGSL